MIVSCHIILNLGQKVQFWSHPISATSSMFAVLLHGLQQTGSLNHSSFHSFIKTIFVKLSTNNCPVDRFSHMSCADFCRSFRVTLGCLAASQINSLLASSVILAGRPCFNRFAVVIRFHF